MAILSPSLVPSLRTDAGRFRELDVLERLRDHLPAQFEVFHSIALHTLHDARDRYGEIDITVLAPDGCLLLIEVKAGQVLLRDGEIFKVYSDAECDVARQTRVQRTAMLNRLQEAGLKTPVISCLVVPDYALGDSQVISIPRERIIDEARYGEMVTLVQHWLGAIHSDVDRAAVRRLLLNQFRVTPHMDVLRNQLQGTVRQLSDGLATWVPRIDAPSGVFRIQATAGSGKTQMALQLLESAVEARTSAAYVCFNRSLADHVRRIAPTRAEVVNFHELCVEHHRRQHGDPEFGAQSFERMALAYQNASKDIAPRLDLLVIDEAQDFDPDWVESLCNQLRPGGKLYLLEDECQRLYQQADFELGDAVVIRCRDNFRSPRAICDMINGLALAPAIRSMNPYRGELPEVRTYATDEQLLAATQAAVSALLARGFALADIAIVTGRGRDKSLLLNTERIGQWNTRRWTGGYDRNGEPLWSDGELLVESVYRYKGQSAPAVIVAEFDFAELDERARRKLFVALTRAQIAASLVLSTSAERCLVAALDGASQA
jgi:superfamily I DNA/RNA helicase